MSVVIILIVAFIIFRGLGVLGVPAFRTWQNALPWAMATMLFFTGGAHFSSLTNDFVQMVPHWMPYPRVIVYLTGVLEILGAIGLLLPATRRLAAICLILLFLAMFPANVHAAVSGLTLGGQPATPLWLRIPMQLLFIAVTWLAGRTGQVRKGQKNAVISLETIGAEIRR